MAVAMERRNKAPLSRRALYFIGRSCILAAAITHPAETFSYAGKVVVGVAEGIGTAAVAVFNLANAQDDTTETEQIALPAITVNVAENTPTSTIIEQPQIPVVEAIGIADGWMLAPNYKEVINSLNIEQYKKDFMVMVVENIQIAMVESTDKGYVVNPLDMAAQVAIETGYGTDTLSGPANNFFGAKAYGDDPFITVKTREVENGKNVYKYQNFRKYPRPADSFNDYIRMLNKLKHFTDTVGKCRWDYRYVASALEDERDPETCELLVEQGGMSILFPPDIVKSYASDEDYTETVIDVVKSLKLEQIFVREA